MNGLQSGDASSAFGSFQKNVRQLESVRAFAIDFMRTLSSTFCMDECSDEKTKMKNAMSTLVAGLKRPRADEPTHTPMPVSEAVRQARTIIGKNNDIYLQVGISMLWTGDAGGDEKFDTDAVDDSNTLFPSSIKSYGQMQQLSVDATALSLLRGRKEALEMRQRNLKDELKHTLFPLLAYLLSIPSLKLYAFAESEEIRKKIESKALTPEIDSTVTEQLRYTTKLWSDINDSNTKTPTLYDGIKKHLETKLNDANSSAKFRELMGACVTLIDILLRLLQTEETQPLGALNMAIVNTCLCDAAANRTQFTPTTLLAMQPSDALTPADSKLYHAALNVNKDLVEQIESMKLNFKAPDGTLPSSLFSPLAKSKAAAPVSKDLRPPFSPLEIAKNYSTLTALQMMPVYTCATRQLFCTPSPTQTCDNQPFRWYSLPMGSEIERSRMRSEAEDEVWRVWDQAVFQPSKAEEKLNANALPQETIVSNFTPTLRYKVVGSEILKTSVVYENQGVYVDPTSFNSLPTTFAQWMPLDGSTSDVDVNQFSLSPLSRSACRAAVLGALVVGAESILKTSDAALDTSIKRFVALVKLHQLGPLLYTRNNPNQWNQWNTSKYLATLNVETETNNESIRSYMEAPLPPLYIDNNIVTTEFIGGREKSTFALKSYAFDQDSTESVGTEAVKVLPLFGNLQKISITKVRTSFDQDKTFQYSSTIPSPLPTINSMKLEDTTNPLTKQHNLLSSLRTMLQGRPYNRSIGNETLDESYADDGRPLLRLFHHTLMANRTLLHQCQRHNESIELFSDMLNRTYDGEDAQKSARRGNPDNPDNPDEGFYQGSAALEAQRKRGVPDAVERGRREAVWKDALRELTVSGDRLFVFLKTLAGLLHDDVQNIIKMEDRSMEQAQRVRAEQRREALRATMSFSQRSMDALMGAIFRQSNFRLDVDASQDGSDQAKNMTGELVVVSEETVERIRKLANDTNNRSFFEAQTQLTSFLEKNKGVSMRLESLIQGVRSVIRTQLTESLDMANRIDVHDERGAMDFLAQPRNSLIIRLKNETFAAIRQAYDALEVEMIAQGYRLMLGSVSVYACVEGNSRRLCDQFAALSAYFMSQSRLFSSSASVYVSTQSASSNALMLRVALQKCVMRAVEYHRGQY